MMILHGRITYEYDVEEMNESWNRYLPNASIVCHN